MAASESDISGLSNGKINSESEEIVDLLVSLGTDLNTAKTVICLHTHGPSKSICLQEKCELRQPDVSIAISKLKELGIVKILPTSIEGRGRPSHTYELSVPLNEALNPFREQASKRLSVIKNQLTRLNELTDSVSN